MATIRFEVKKPFSWEGKPFTKGSRVEIEEGHPRLAMMLKGNHIGYDLRNGPVKT